ncbi:energy-coupling factor transporter transmembrane component T family protein [Selenomonas sp. F0473]|uniref:energy-coupling factor transporter transmembrane component T family protein n=1 Tax=Selenomonas sp. F0473 TaxID=999423 RepID=UPI0025DF0A36|nr:energy-coupling factor transporter transmembrane component T [Selenomonas sp. F0473]
MLQDIQIGRYLPGDSFLHRMDARVKILLLVGFLLLVFFVENPAGVAVLCAATALLMVTSRVPLMLQLRSVRPILWIVVFTFLVHLFMTPGTAAFRLGVFTATWEGLARGGYIGLRLILLILLSTLLTLTTSPLQLTDGLEALMSPLRRVGIPVHELSMMMTIALRFVPTLLEEMDRIMKAQKARGMDFEQGNILRRLRAVVPILVPLFLSAFRRADELALAMEARCYHGGEGRTRMKEMRVGRLDYAAIGIFLAGAACVYLASLGGLRLAP